MKTLRLPLAAAVSLIACNFAHIGNLALASPPKGAATQPAAKGAATQPAAKPAQHSPEDKPAPSQQPSLLSRLAHNPPDLTLRFGDWVSLTPGAMFQLRYTANWRGEVADDEDPVTQGFAIRRMRLQLSGKITDYLGFFLRMGVNGGGAFALERAIGNIYLGDFTISGGQFHLPIFSEGENIAPRGTLGADYSTTSIVFEPGAAQGLQLQYNPDHVRVRLAYSNGVRTGFSDFGRQQDAADYAFTANTDVLLFSKNWKPMSHANSFRGAETFVKLGVGLHYQDGGNTSDTLDLSLLYLAGDVRAGGSGWNVMGQVVWTREDPGPELSTEPGVGDPLHDLGYMLQGGLFVLSWLEPFARFSHIIPDRGARPSELYPGAATSDFRTLTGGLNLFLIPGTYMARLTLEYQYMFDGQQQSAVPVVLSEGILPTTGNQWNIRTQLTFSI